MSDPRNNPEDAYQACMSMPNSEWTGLLMSLLRGGVLTPAEQEGFDRAMVDRAAALINIQCPQCGETVDTLKAGDFRPGEITNEDRDRGWAYADAPCDTCISEEEEHEADKA